MGTGSPDALVGRLSDEGKVAEPGLQSSRESAVPESRRKQGGDDCLLENEGVEITDQASGGPPNFEFKFKKWELFGIGSAGPPASDTGLIWMP